MKKTLFFQWFNLIEVTMAVAVVGIGIAGVMALFPPAIEANKSADFQNFTGTVVNNVATYLDYNVKHNWSSFTGGVKEKDSATKPTAQTDTSTWDEIAGFNALFTTGNTSVKDWLGIKTQDGTIAAHVRIWKDNANLSKGYFDKTEVTIAGDNRVRIVVELSWPVHVAYADREKQEFVYEFNKPDNSSAEPETGD